MLVCRMKKDFNHFDYWATAFMCLFITGSVVYIIYLNYDTSAIEQFCEKNGFDGFVSEDSLCLDTEKSLARKFVFYCVNYKCKYYFIGDNMKIDVGGNSKDDSNTTLMKFNNFIIKCESPIFCSINLSDAFSEASSYYEKYNNSGDDKK